MRQSIKQGVAIYKNATTHQISGMPKTPLASVQSSSKRVAATTNLFSLPPHCPGELERSQEHPAILMQHQENSTDLGQKINQVILNSTHSQMLLIQLAQVLGESFRVDWCFIMAVGSNDDSAQAAHWDAGNHLKVLLQQQILALNQLASVVAAAAEALVIDDVQAVDNSPIKEWQHLRLPVKPVLGIPTWFQGKISGVILLMRSQPYQWTSLEKERALTVAAPVAIAMSQAAQTKLIASLNQQVQTSAQYQTLLNKLTTASRSSLELNQILQMALAGTAQSIQVDRGLILLLKYAEPHFKSCKRKQIPQAKATVVCEWPSDDYPGVLDSNIDTNLQHRSRPLLNQSFWISECCLCQQALKTSPKPVAIADIQALTPIDLDKDIAPLFNLAQSGGLFILPLENQGTVLGFLVLQHADCRLFSSEELVLLEMVATQLSSAIIQSQTLRQVQSLVEERTAQLHSSLEVQAKLYEKTRRQIDQLRELNQIKDEFLSTVNHELRTPLTSMSLAIRMLRQPGLSEQRQLKYLDILEQQCTQEINLINDLLTLQELQSHQTPINLETIDLKPKLQELAQSFKQKWADKKLTITVHLPKAPLLLQTEVDSLNRILQELLTNAGKYSNPDTTVVLRVIHQPNQQVNQIILTLTNIGPSISPKEATHIFDKFHRGQSATHQAIQGTGLGLALVKCLVQHLNGTIDVSTCPGNPSIMSETCFTLTLPQLLEAR